MPDLNTMLREHAITGLQSQLDAAVQAGDSEAARKINDQLADLKVATAPKARPYGDAEIRAELDKQTWFGTDPKKSAKAMEFGKTLDPGKFATAALFAAAVVKAVDEEFKTPGAGHQRGNENGEEEGNENGEEEGNENGEEDEGETERTPAPKRKASDAPGERDAGGGTRRKSSGPWTKLADAPNDVRTEISRQADKFGPKDKEGREKFIGKALEASYNAAQRSKRK